MLHLLRFRFFTSLLLDALDQWLYFVVYGELLSKLREFVSVFSIFIPQFINYIICIQTISDAFATWKKKTFQCLLFIPFNLKQNSHFLFERSCNFACIFSSVHGLTDMIGWCRVRLNRFGVKLCLFMFCTWISLAHFNQNVHASPATIGVFCFSNPCLIS